MVEVGLGIREDKEWAEGKKMDQLDKGRSF